VTLVRSAAPSELDSIAQLWHDVWFETHAHLVPPSLIRLRTFENFRERLEAALDQVRVVGPQGAPVGFCMTKKDELYQIWVAPAARGTGAAAALMADAEQRIARQGYEKAWLACSVGNERAARFYEKCGWINTGVVNYPADTAEGPVGVDVWRFERALP
jgi:ribosomal protein S18 acetylase RimI-like enzyme